MKCKHCDTPYSLATPCDRPIGGGHAYAQTCMTCFRIVRLRPASPMDPPALPPIFTPEEIARLEFHRWRFHTDMALHARAS